MLMFLVVKLQLILYNEDNEDNEFTDLIKACLDNSFLMGHRLANSYI